MLHGRSMASFCVEKGDVEFEETAGEGESCNDYIKRRIVDA